MTYYLREDLKPLFPESRVTEFSAIEGEIYRAVAGRRTARFERGGKRFFIKSHLGVGWTEIFKNLLFLRLPILGAGNEWRAIKKVESLGLHTTPITAYGEAGLNPATRCSFIITEALPENAQDLEWWAQRIKEHANPVQRVRAKRKLIERVATVARTLHENGINHRDLYICHLRLDADPKRFFENPETGEIYIMDLHRAQCRDRVPLRWRAKDLDGLLYSTLHGPAKFPLGRNDIICFLRAYLGSEWRFRLSLERRLWWMVVKRFCRDYEKDHGEAPILPPVLHGVLG